jgi:beta-glucosidase
MDGEAMLHLRGGSQISGQTFTYRLTHGRPVEIELQWDSPTDSTDCTLQWRPPGAAPRAGAAGSPADRAVAAAAKADVVLFIGGLNHDYDAEGSDRPDLKMPGGQDALIERLAATNPRTAVVLVAGAAIAMPWTDRVPAILLTGYGGMEAGHALADVLRGAVNPSGKLPYSIPVRLEDTPAHAPGMGTYERGEVEYRENVFVGYRWHDARAIPPRFPFGHGLSYTAFGYSDLRIERAGLPEGRLTRVRCRVTNTGVRAGAEVVQLYVGDAASELPRPPCELKAFRKVRLAPGAEVEVVFDLGPEAFRYWHPGRGGWFVEPGRFTIELGSSSRDARLTGELEIG